MAEISTCEIDADIVSRTVLMKMETSVSDCFLDSTTSHGVAKTNDDIGSAHPPLLAKLPAERLLNYLHVCAEMYHLS